MQPEILKLEPLSILFDQNFINDIKSYYLIVGTFELYKENLLSVDPNKDNRNIEQILFDIVSELKEKFNVVIQLFNADLILSKKHIYYAVNFALTNYLLNKMISKKLEIEILVYASLQNQINLSLKLFKIDLTRNNKYMLSFCILRKNKENILNAYEYFQKRLKIESILELSSFLNFEKIINLKNIYKIEDQTLLNSLNTLGFNTETINKEIPIEILESALLKCVIEKMAFINFRS